MSNEKNPVIYVSYEQNEKNPPTLKPFIFLYMYIYYINIQF